MCELDERVPRTESSANWSACRLGLPPECSVAEIHSNTFYLKPFRKLAALLTETLCWFEPITMAKSVGLDRPQRITCSRATFIFRLNASRISASSDSFVIRCSISQLQRQGPSLDSQTSELYPQSIAVARNDTALLACILFKIAYLTYGSAPKIPSQSSIDAASRVTRQSASSRSLSLYVCPAARAVARARPRMANRNHISRLHAGRKCHNSFRRVPRSGRIVVWVLASFLLFLYPAQRLRTPRLLTLLLPKATSTLLCAAYDRSIDLDVDCASFWHPACSHNAYRTYRCRQLAYLTKTLRPCVLHAHQLHLIVEAVVAAIRIRQASLLYLLLYPRRSTYTFSLPRSYFEEHLPLQ